MNDDFKKSAFKRRYAGFEVGEFELITVAQPPENIRMDGPDLIRVPFSPVFIIKKFGEQINHMAINADDADIVFRLDIIMF